ncbi:putative methyltransferase [Botryosphaeria dothidea RNA virus 1]|uniref:Methyltransferase n=1 Tax=Botryosphaeria dothidea RNA virus 1 TaxID=2849745 RepID=A0A1P7ZIM4_9VIRU|nr:putative methyltransferase [Botryosphaeria dothidea RNA virus 1]
MKRRSAKVPAQSRSSARTKPTPPPSPELHRQSTSGVSHLALSVRSKTTVGKEFRTTQGDRVRLPFNIFEFGFPRKPHGNQLPVRRQFHDAAGEEFMSSEAGAQLRAVERKYAAVMRTYINRTMRVTGSRILVLGSGSSRGMIPILRRLPASAVFVDTNQDALDTLEDNLASVGLLAPIDATFVNQDAWEYLENAEVASYDLILATKCMGLVYAVDPVQRHPDAFFAMASRALAEDGSVVTDEHVAYAGERHGTPIPDVTAPEDFALATIAGRYAGDVCYTAQTTCTALDLVAKLTFDSVGHGVQEWAAYHYRARRTPTPSQAVVRTGLPTPPKAFRRPALLEFDEAADARIPVNAKGVKRAPMPSDLCAHDLSRALPKFDGHPGVVIIKRGTAVFLGSRYRFVRELPIDVAMGVELMGEVVHVGPEKSIVVITGLLAVGDARADPLSLDALNQVRPLVAAMGPAGFMINSPDLLRALQHDRVYLSASWENGSGLPVDGVHVELAGRNGVFFKNAAENTIDATADDVEGLLAESYSILRLPAPSLALLERAKAGGVWEFSRDTRSHAWVPVRPRPDKRNSDKIGAVVATVNASVKAQQLGLLHTAASIVKRVLR